MFEEICVNPTPVEFTVEFQGKSYKFVKKALTWGQINEFQSKAITVAQEPGTKQAVMHLNRRQYAEDCLVAMLVETPWPIAETRIMLRKLDQAFGDLLISHVPDLTSTPGENVDFFDESYAESLPIHIPGVTL